MGSDDGFNDLHTVVDSLFDGRIDMLWLDVRKQRQALQVE